MIERRNKKVSWHGDWSCAGEIFIDRDYELFAVLSGVRDTDYPVPTISEPRGVPKDASSAFKGFIARMRRELPGAVHSPSWATLAEILAYDLDQDFYDGSLVTERGPDGRIVRTTNSANASLANFGPVGIRKVLSLPSPNHRGREQWDMIILEMRHAKEHWGLESDYDVRLCFFFHA